MFKPAAMPVLEFLPALIKGTSVRAWDLASSTPGDYTVGLKLALRVDYLGAAATLCFGLARDRADHALI